jgi:hypothetical protein
MLTASGPKLLDFGLAKSQAALPAASNLTIPGMILGTMQYMAPEQFDGAEADRRTDIFAFGVVLHEMITGKKAFEGKSQVLLISAIATSTPPPVSRVQVSAPPALDHVIKTCLEKDPADRWQDARDLLAELQWIADGGEEGGFSWPGRWSTRRRWLRRQPCGAASWPCWPCRHGSTQGPAEPEMHPVPRTLPNPRKSAGKSGNAAVFNPLTARFLQTGANRVSCRPVAGLVPVRAAGRRRDAAEDGGHRGRRSAVLVGRQPVSGIRRARTAQARASIWRRARGCLQRAGVLWRRVEPGGQDHLRLSLGSVYRPRRGRDAKADDDAGRG